MQQVNYVRNHGHTDWESLQKAIGLRIYVTGFQKNSATLYRNKTRLHKSKPAALSGSAFQNDVVPTECQFNFQDPVQNILKEPC